MENEPATIGGQIDVTFNSGLTDREVLEEIIERFVESAIRDLSTDEEVYTDGRADDRLNLFSSLGRLIALKTKAVKKNVVVAVVEDFSSNIRIISR